VKTILVDAINGLVNGDGTIYSEMLELLESYPNPKIVLTGANDEQYVKYNLEQVPYDVFTLKHDPEKTDPRYFDILLTQYKLSVDDVVYFEHNQEAVDCAQNLGIVTYFYDHNVRDLDGLKKFLDTSL
jgi:FMN phosphatase YigB (HAD superfamily)